MRLSRCGHCKKLAPTYAELADSFKSVASKVNIASVDGDAHKDLSSRFGIGGFPTIKFFDGKSPEPQDYNGGRDLESLQAFITEKTGLRPKKALTRPSDIVQATDSTFKDLVGGSKDVLVAFTAPWCGHCKTLAPVWEELAHDFASEEDVVIAKVDAEANKGVAKEFGISGYPTIKFFPKGSKTPVDYSQGRDQKSFVEYVNEKAGTHRAVGGGLDATAGTIQALDAVIGKLTGSSLAEISKEAAQVAKGLQGKYAEYYIKVLDKLSANKDYVSKETKRLEGILKKGGIEARKQDDLTSRLNILKKFLTGEAYKEEL